MSDENKSFENSGITGNSETNMDENSNFSLRSSGTYTSFTSNLRSSGLSINSATTHGIPVNEIPRQESRNKDCIVEIYQSNFDCNVSALVENETVGVVSHLNSEQKSELKDDVSVDNHLQLNMDFSLKKRRIPTSISLSPDTPSGLDNIMQNIDRLIELKLARSSTATDFNNVVGSSNTDIDFRNHRSQTEPNFNNGLLDNTYGALSNNVSVPHAQEPTDEGVRESFHYRESTACNPLPTTVSQDGIGSSQEDMRDTATDDDATDASISSANYENYLLTEKESCKPFESKDHSCRRPSLEDRESRFELVGISGNCTVNGSSSVTSELFCSVEYSHKSSESEDEIEEIFLDVIRKLSVGNEVQDIPGHRTTDGERSETPKSINGTASPFGSASPFKFSSAAYNALDNEDEHYRFTFCSDQSGPPTDAESTGGRDSDILSDEGDTEKRDSDLRRAIFGTFAHPPSIPGELSPPHNSSYSAWSEVALSDKEGIENAFQNPGGNEDDSLRRDVYHKSHLIPVQTEPGVVRSLLMNNPTLPVKKMQSSFAKSPTTMQSENERVAESDSTDVEMDEVETSKFCSQTDLDTVLSLTASKLSMQLHLPELNPENSSPESSHFHSDTDGQIVEVVHANTPNDPLPSNNEASVEEDSENSCRDSAFYELRDDPSPDMPSLPTVTLDYFVSSDTTTPTEAEALPGNVDVASTEDLSFTPLTLSNDFLPSEVKSLNLIPSFGSSMGTTSESQATPASSLSEYHFPIRPIIEDTSVMHICQMKDGEKDFVIVAKSGGTNCTSTKPMKKSSRTSRSVSALSTTTDRALRKTQPTGVSKRNSLPRRSKREPKAVSDLKSHRRSVSQPAITKSIVTVSGNLQLSKSAKTKPKKKYSERHNTGSKVKTMKPLVEPVQNVKFRSRTKIAGNQKDSDKRRSWPPMQSDCSFRKFSLKRSASFRCGMNRASSESSGSERSLLSPEKKNDHRRTLSAGSSPLRLKVCQKPVCIIDSGAIMADVKKNSSSRISKNKSRQTAVSVNKDFVSKVRRYQDVGVIRRRLTSAHLKREVETTTTCASLSPSSGKADSKSKIRLVNKNSSILGLQTNEKSSAKSPKRRSLRVSRSTCADSGDSNRRKRRDPSSSEDRAQKAISIRSQVTRANKKEIPSKLAANPSSSCRVPILKKSPSPPSKPDRPKKPIGAIKALGVSMQSAQDKSRVASQKNIITTTKSNPKSTNSRRGAPNQHLKSKSPVSCDIYKDMHKVCSVLVK